MAADVRLRNAASKEEAFSRQTILRRSPRELIEMAAGLLESSPAPRSPCRGVPDDGPAIAAPFAVFPVRRFVIPSCP
jgi:hypothetical protein